MELEAYMLLAISEAKESLREGNNGFGAVIVRDGEVIAVAHDREDTEEDPTSHAEINAIREASRKLGKKLDGCLLVSTHEPCPMCASAIIWAGIGEVAWGTGIEEAMAQGRNRIDLPCVEIFSRARAGIQIHEEILKTECSVLYRKEVRREISALRDADDAALDELNADSVCRRTQWFRKNRESFDFITQDPVESAYRLLLARFGITQEKAPVIKKTDTEIVFHSMNFCPTLEACKILGLDTRHVCERLNERSANALVKQIDTRLGFSRNYEKLRPYAEYCEEKISIED